MLLRGRGTNVLPLGKDLRLHRYGEVDVQIDQDFDDSVEVSGEGGDQADNFLSAVVTC